jgi:thioredoxin reductase (NADPH)
MELSDGHHVRSRTVVVATGARYLKLDASNYDRYRYQGVHYAATGMEGMLCKGQEIAVVGGGNSAGQAAIFLASFAKHVHLVVRRPSLEDAMSRYLTTRIARSSRISVHTSTIVDSLNGEPHLENVELVNQQSGERSLLAVRALFVMIGAEPNSLWLRGSVDMDKNGFIMTGLPGAFENSRYATSLPGVYAVGDIRSDSVKRVASAAGEGSVVISDIHRFLAHRSM